MIIRLRLMRMAVSVVCHVVIPVCVAWTGFYVFALMTHDLRSALGGLVLAGGVAFISAWGYALFAIGPRFVDMDFPITWGFVGRRLVKLLLLLLLTPLIVLSVYLLTAPFTEYCRLAAVLSGLPSQWFVSLFLHADDQTWSWRLRRGRIVQTDADVRKKIATHARRVNSEPGAFVPWAGMMVPPDLMAPHTKIFGMSGSGKTITIRLLVQWLVSRCSPASNTKLVIFDPKRELYSYIIGMDPQVPVLLFDATDRRGLAWDIASDITEPNHAKAAAKLLVPDEQTTQPYFARSGRRILECVMRYLIIHADHWNLQDAFMILDDLPVLRRILPRQIVEKYFDPADTLRNTRSTLDTLTSRFETVAACWARAEREGHTLSLNQFEACPTSAILVIPRRLDIADAVDPTIRLIFERLIHLWLGRPDIRFLPPDQRPETHVILDETAKAGSLARLDDLLLMGRAKGVSVTLAAQDIEAMRQEYGEKIADSLLAQCGNTAVFALESPETRDYCANVFGTYEIRERLRTIKTAYMGAALSMHPKDLYHAGDVREHKTLLSSQFANLPRPIDTGLISGYFITGGLGAHYASYPFAHMLLPPANVPVLLPRDPADQEFPDRLTPADLKRLGIPDEEPGTARGPAARRRQQSKTSTAGSSDSLRFVKRMGPT